MDKNNGKNGGVTPNPVGDKKITSIDNKKLIEEYRRNIKDKSHSKSIDTNIQKFNFINAVAALETSDGNVNKANTIQRTNQNTANLKPIVETVTNRVKAVNKNKK